MALIPPPVLQPALYWDEKGHSDEEVDLVFASASAEQKQALRLVSLYANRLTRIPPAVLDMTGLTRLNLIGNPLRCVSPEIGRLVRLKRLYIERCELSTLPVEVNQLTRLTALFFNNNEICTLPPLTKVRSL
jgi:Leucine-rich repeat (LRR) protein